MDEEKRYNGGGLPQLEGLTTIFMDEEKRFSWRRLTQSSQSQVSHIGKLGNFEQHDSSFSPSPHNTGFDFVCLSSCCIDYSLYFERKIPILPDAIGDDGAQK
uniref:Uncharacterized protein n=1 Tax=Cacopsylla melanoneura TaxID=428564 RepID=A0A8D8Y048_9HEMI